MNVRATRIHCDADEFGVFVKGAIVFCRVNSGSNADADEVVSALNNGIARENCGDFHYGQVIASRCAVCGQPRWEHAK